MGQRPFCTGIAHRKPTKHARARYGVLRQETLEEDYLIGMVPAFDGTADDDTLLCRIYTVLLLFGETHPLSEGARQDLLLQRFSWYPDDLVATTWNRAFIYEPHGDSDVMDVRGGQHIAGD
jgi:hypothetical protein